MTDTAELLELAVDAARRSGGILLERFGSPARDVASKSSATDLVSEADHASEAFLAEAIRKVRPEDGILGEEGSAQDGTSGLRWVVDPLDGTVNFLYGIPQWSVSVAVEDAEGGLVGVVHDPNRDETFTAVRGGGARLGDATLRVSGVDDLSRALIVTGFPYDAGLRAVEAERVVRVLPRVRDIRRYGSAAIDLAWVACGRYDGYYEAHMGPWDRAAGELLVREAGGTVTDFGPTGVVASGPAIHDALRMLIDDEEGPR